jgi:pyruvate-formate lyase-activating enzyme
MDENYLAFMVKACGRNGVNFFGGEPGLHFEYVIEAANQCRKRGLLTVLSTNGYLSGWVAEKLAKAVHTTTVGIKASASTEYYRVKLGADASVCLESARIFWNTGFLSQISNLIGPNLGTPEDDVKFAEWISANLDPDYPVRLIPLLDVNTALPVEPWPDVRARVTTTISRLKKGGLHHFYLPQQYDGCGWLND